MTANCKISSFVTSKGAEMKIAKTALLVLAILGLFGWSIDRDSEATIKIVPRQVGSDSTVWLLRESGAVKKPKLSNEPQFQVPKQGEKCNAGLLLEYDRADFDDALDLEE